jgi:hypothetical protein
MNDLLTRADAYAHLRLDVDYGISPDDPWLDIWIPAVSEAVRRWLKDDWRLYEPEMDSAGEVVRNSDGDPVPALDSSGNPTPLAAVKAACLIELERQYRFRGGDGAADVPSDAGWGYVLGKGATMLLAPLRRTTVA